MKKLFKSSYTPITILLIAIAIAASAWQYSGVEWVDDLQYKRMPGEGIEFWYNEGPFIETFGDACEAVYYHHTMVTSRLPNYVQCFTNLIPNIVTDIAHGLMIAILVLMTIVTIGGRKTLKSPLLAGVTALAIWVLLPWYDNMLSSDFLFNYVWVSVACLFFIRLLYSDNIIPARLQHSQWLIAFITGTMHEGFTFPIVAGATMLILLDRTNRRRRILLTTLLALGASFCFFTPGIFARLQNHVVEQSNGSPLHVFAISLTQIYSIYILAIVSIIAIFTNGWKYVIKFFKKEIVLTIAMIAAYIIAIVSGTVHRGLWFVELIGIILTLKILVTTYQWWRRPHLIIGTLSATVMLASLIGTTIWQTRFSAEIREMCRQVETTNRPVAYIDLINPGDAPWWTFNVPQSIASAYGNRCYSYHYGYIKEQNILILPTRYKHLPIEEWDKIPGTAEAMGQFPYYITTKPTDGKLTISTGDAMAASSPTDRLLNLFIGKNSAKKEIPMQRYYWGYATDNGDTLYCHNINQMGRTMRHRKVIAIDL